MESSKADFSMLLRFFDYSQAYFPQEEENSSENDSYIQDQH